MSKYTTIEKIENYLLTEIDSSFESEVEYWIEVMSSYIEKETGRTFIADEEASIRVYDGTGKDMIIIDDAIEIESVAVDDEEIDFLSYPANTIPKTAVRTETGYFTKGKQNIDVSAKWGYSEEVPKDIEFVCTVFVSGIIQYSLDHEGELASISLGRYTASYKTEKQVKDIDMVGDILQKYKRYM